MKKFLAIFLGLLLGCVVATSIKSPQVANDSYQASSSPQFTVAVVLVYMGAAAFAVMYAVERGMLALFALFAMCLLLAIAIIWSV